MYKRFAALILITLALTGLLTLPLYAQSTPQLPYRAWSLSPDGLMLYVLDNRFILYRLDALTLAPMDNSTPLGRPDFDLDTVHNTPIHLLASDNYLFVSSPWLTKTVVLNRADYDRRYILDWAGPMALEPGRRLFMISNDTSFYDRTSFTGPGAYDRPGLFAFDLTNLNALPDPVIEPWLGQYGSYPTGLVINPAGRRLYVGSTWCCGSHGPYIGWGVYDLDTYQALGRLDTEPTGSRLSSPTVDEQNGQLATTTDSNTGPLSNYLVILNRDGQQLSSRFLLHARQAVFAPSGEWLYVLRYRDLWLLHSDDFSLQGVLPLSVSSSPSDLRLSPDGRLLYLFSPDDIKIVQTAELQNLGLEARTAIPDIWNCENCSPWTKQFRYYPSPQMEQDGFIFFSMAYGETYRSTDHGQSWTFLPGLTYPDFKYITSLSLSPDFTTDQTLVATQASSPTFRSTDAGQSWNKWIGPIAFVSDRDGNNELYTMLPDGTDVRRLTHHPAADENPAWSPAWTRLAFQSNRNGNWDIYTIRLDCDHAAPDAETACDLRQLTNDPADDMLPAWSPDGRWIAFVSTRDGNPELYLTDPTGQSQRRLTNHPNGDWRPAWFSNSRDLAFTTTRNSSNDIYRLTLPYNLTLTSTLTITFTPIITGPADDRDPTIAIDNLYFQSNRDGSYQIYSYALNYQDITHLETTQPTAHPSAVDSSQILVTLDINGQSDIYRLERYGSNPPKPLTGNPAFDGQPAARPMFWLPDQR